MFLGLIRTLCERVGMGFNLLLWRSIDLENCELFGGWGGVICKANVFYVKFGWALESLTKVHNSGDHV